VEFTTQPNPNLLTEAAHRAPIVYESGKKSTAAKYEACDCHQAA